MLLNSESVVRSCFLKASLRNGPSGQIKTEILLGKASELDFRAGLRSSLQLHDQRQYLGHILCSRHASAMRSSGLHSKRNVSFSAFFCAAAIQVIRVAMRHILCPGPQLQVQPPHVQAGCMDVRVSFGCAAYASQRFAEAAATTARGAQESNGTCEPLHAGSVLVPYVCSGRTCRDRVLPMVQSLSASVFVPSACRV